MWDPLRRKEVADTPEERVRQWFIGVLAEAGCPMGLMGSEVQLKLGSKSLRADIVVYGRNGSPVTVVECKRPDVSISKETAEQALRYHSVLGVRFICLTNGNNTYIYRRGENGAFTAMDRIPSYQEML